MKHSHFSLTNGAIAACLILASSAAGADDQPASIPVPDRATQVTIIRDTYGIPHIHGRTDADVAFGLAYAHAEDDFGLLQETLISARGRLRDVKGAKGGLMDYLVQLLKVREFVAEKYETDLSPDVREYVEAYAAGMTYYAQLHPEKADERFLPYTGQDVVAGFVQRQPFFFGLDKVISKLQKPQADGTKQKAAFLPVEQLPPIGSNTFAIGPARSADGKTRLNINSHQPWEGPVTWYEAHLKSDEGLDIIGGLFPGAPSILHGHNQHLGWAFTVNKPDLIDVYELEINPNNKNQYKLDGEWRDFEVGEADLSMKVFGTAVAKIKREMLYSVHGPAVRFPHGTYAVRFAGWGEVRGVEQYFRMNKARNFDEWIAAVKQRWIPSLNTCYADKDGNIYYLYNGLIPKRAEGYDWSDIVPGDQSHLVWEDYVPFESLPQVKNPAAGFLQNANSTPFAATLGDDNPQPEDFSPTLGIETRHTDRALRITELFAADDSITHEECLTYKWDQTVTKQGQVWRRIQPLFEGTPPADLAEVTAILRKWDRVLAADSQSAAVAALVNYQYEKASFFSTPEPEPWEALRAAVAHLREHFGGLEVTLGDVQRLRRGNADLPIGGGPRCYNCVHAREDEEDGRLVGLVGDSYVLIVAFDENGVASSQAIHQYGNVNIPDSPHYADQAPMFVNREMRHSLLTEAEISANTSVSYHPGEELEQ